MGWAHGDQELFTRDEIATLFDLDAVHRSAAQADPVKLSWLNQQWIKTIPRAALITELLPFLEAAAGHPVPRTVALEQLVELLRERSRDLAEMARLARFLVVEEIAWEEKAAAKHLRPELRPLLAELHDRLAALAEWSPPAIEAVFHAVREQHGGLALGKLAQPVRVAVTGGEVSPPIFDTLAVLGKARSVARIADAVHELRTQH